MKQEYSQIIHLYRKDYSKKLEQMIQEYEEKVGTGRIAEEIKIERDYMNESSDNTNISASPPWNLMMEPSYLLSV